MKKKRFSSDFCMACCALLPPFSQTCPHCGVDNQWLPGQDDPIDDRFLAQMPDDTELDSESVSDF